MTGPASVDLHLRVRTIIDSSQKRRFAYELTSPSGLAAYRLEGESPPLGSSTSGAVLMAEDLERLLRGFYTESYDWTSDRIETKLRSIGKNLFARLLPPSIRDVLNKRCGEPCLSLLIESDETDIPWEIVHTAGGQGDFLALGFRLARWLSQELGPVVELDVSQIVCIEAGSIDDFYLGKKKLPAIPNAAAEVAILEEMGRAEAGPAVDIMADAHLDDVLQRLAGGNFQLLHFVGHADLPASQPDRASLYLNGGELEAQDLVDPLPEALAPERPFVFLNACRAGDQQQAIAGLGGWPHRWIEVCGAGGFLAPQWAVKSTSAFDFAQELYAGLNTGMALGEAVRRSRFVAPRGRGGKSGTTTGNPPAFDPSLLAYTFYGHPNAIIRFGSSSTPTNPPEGPKESAGKGSERFYRAATPNLIVAGRRRSPWAVSPPLFLTFAAVIVLSLLSSLDIWAPSSSPQLSKPMLTGPVALPSIQTEKPSQPTLKQGVELSGTPPPGLDRSLCKREMENAFNRAMGPLPPIDASRWWGTLKLGESLADDKKETIKCSINARLVLTVDGSLQVTELYGRGAGFDKRPACLAAFRKVADQAGETLRETLWNLSG